VLYDAINAFEPSCIIALLCASSYRSISKSNFDQSEEKKLFAKFSTVKEKAGKLLENKNV
jgi:hypothetical protein